ncbi:four-carbon acid sugar kinase family protein [Citrobacter sedlakii]|uniref:3-oxo-tetronate kinase n=1 Tax=Citrobacter sedlakii TaxID=67826 RepID=UPI0022A4F078|nr:four-carbon acid sugar kinase family protein [Citrobacter sedlakii]HCU0294894.1 four-carbon acid sugar kinase family protein [Citrobacter sedlakii]
MPVTTGVIADDFTGATDIASFMAEQGWRVALLPGMPDAALPWNEEVDAIVISLKSRSLPADQAIDQSLRCWQWLHNTAGARQIYFKYCSTFDSTPAGNIGPVSDALMEAMHAPYIVHCPALPQNGRTVIHGYLFVNGVLLNESGMEKHPLNPMTDANLIRLLTAQTASAVGRIDLRTIQKGVEAVTHALERCQSEGVRHVIADTFSEADLQTLAQALRHTPLLAGGSGLGGALAACAASQRGREAVHPFPQPAKTVVFSGSCSTMSNRQVNRYKAQAASLLLDVARCLTDAERYSDELSLWTMTHVDDALAPLIYATQPPEALKRIQQEYGEQRASRAIEQTFARLTAKLQAAGVTGFIVAGGETSGTVVEALQVTRLTVGKAIAPGVPWVFSAEPPLALALKSGNFGDEDFFFTAQESAL